MSSLALVVALSLGGVDSLTKVTLEGLSFKAPSSWNKTQAEPNSISWDEPESGASMAVSVFPVDPVRPAKSCVQQLVDALGKEGFAFTTLGAQPASKKVMTDYVGAEELGDRVREALGAHVVDVEAIELLSQTWAAALPPPAQERLGLRAGQKNALVRITLRAVDRTLTDAEANRLRDEVYAALHEGSRAEWACGAPPWARAS